MTLNKSEDITRLPKWAQWKIGRIEGELLSAREALDNATGATPSNICIEPDAPLIRTGARLRYVPDRTTIEYKVELGTIEVTLREGVVKISAMSDVGTLAIEPVVSNAFNIRIIPE